MNAELACTADPFSRELEAVSATLASAATGRVSQGTLRWGRALGYVSDTEMGKLEQAGHVGDFARESGPAFDENKPIEESSETK